MRGLVHQLRRWARVKPLDREPVIGLALGGGFARGMAHLGVLRVFQEHSIPIHMMAGVSAGAIVAAAYASGTRLDEIACIARSMKFTDVATWTISAMGLAGSERMAPFLRRLLRTCLFEDMRIPLAVVATDLRTGSPIIFRDRGDVLLPVRASCSYPGLFQPVRHGGRLLVDGAISMEIPAAAVRKMGATHVVSVCLPANGTAFDPGNMFSVVNRCFQIMQARTEREWRKHSSVVVQPDVNGMKWDCFDSCQKLIETGELAARAALPRILGWLRKPEAMAPSAA